MKRFLVGLGALIAIAAVYLPLPVAAQVPNTLVITTCGTVPTPFQTGRAAPLTVLTDGTLCARLAGGSGGTLGTVMLGDGTTSPVAVKPAATPATNADKSLTVSIRPDSLNSNGGATPANSAPVVPANQYSQYETVAASATAQFLGPAGATGDYLSHCLIQPTALTPGVVTIFDNTNAAATNVVSFPGGTLPSLIPFAVPVGAFSTAGAWKVTTGVNVTVACYGKFT